MYNNDHNDDKVIMKVKVIVILIMKVRYDDKKGNYSDIMKYNDEVNTDKMEFNNENMETDLIMKSRTGLRVKS